MAPDVLEVRAAFDGYTLAHVARRDGRIVRDRPVLGEDGAPLIFRTSQEANDLRKLSGRALDDWMRRASTAQIERAVGERGGRS